MSGLISSFRWTSLTFALVTFMALDAWAQDEPGGDSWGPPPSGQEDPEEPGDGGGSDDWGPPPSAVAPDPEPEPEPEPYPEEIPEPANEEPDVPQLEEPEERLRQEFGFGSYGRVGAATDFQGSTPRAVSVVAHAPRVVENPYLEIDFYYTLDPVGPYTIRTVTTLAFTEDLFHYTGDFSSILALRNLYAEFIYDDMLSVWAGSRMYRGDDMYLLDFWPLDQLNTIGAGVGFWRGPFDIRFHMGVNRLNDDFTFQEYAVAGRLFGAEQVVLMDRQRLVASLSAGYRLWGPANGPAIRLKAYFEFHYLASGSYRREDETMEDLPSDVGWTGGLQLGSWGWGERDSHANLFIRFSQGLAAYGDLGVPYDLDQDKRSFPNASELLIGLSANYERGRFGLMGAAYVRRNTDADPNEYDYDDGWEFVIDVRPWVTLFGPLQFACDISYQMRLPSGMSPSALELLNPGVFQLAPMIVFAPLGPGSYLRPHIRLVYRMAYLNEGARDTYTFDDPRRNEEFAHYFGVQVEWWFNSSYR